jgi:hypothetical protein
MTSSSCCGEELGKRHDERVEVMFARPTCRGVEGATWRGGVVRCRGKMLRMMAWREVSDKDVMGPEVRGDRISARNGETASSGEICVMSTVVSAVLTP